MTEEKKTKKARGRESRKGRFTTEADIKAVKPKAIQEAVAFAMKRLGITNFDIFDHQSTGGHQLALSYLGVDDYPYVHLARITEEQGAEMADVYVLRVRPHDPEPHHVGRQWFRGD